MEKTFNVTNIAWLRVTDFMHAWLEREMGCEVKIGEQRVICLQHLQGAREALRMEACNDMEQCRPVANAMSATLYNCISAGINLDPDTIKEEYDLTTETMRLFMPIETPKLCLTKEGVLRPWTTDIAMGREQAAAVQRVIRTAFWSAVDEFNAQYARLKHSSSYPARNMIEAFCVDTRTPDTYVDAMRREWQRRAKRNGNSQNVAPGQQKKAMRIMSLIY